MPNGAVRTELRKAFKIWSEVSQLTFTEVNSTGADIVVSFERGQHGDGFGFNGQGEVIAHAFFPGPGIGGHLHFDAEEPWVVKKPPPGIDGTPLFPVAAHEIGHTLGLSHSSVPGALMGPLYQTINDVDNFHLPADDVSAIQALYGARNATHLSPPSPFTSDSNDVTHPEATSYSPTPRIPSLSLGPVKSPVCQDPQMPSACNTTIDAISLLRKEIFIFKEKYVWRLKQPGDITNMYPVEINRLWKDLSYVDAVYERVRDSKIVFFSGDRYWLFDGVNKEPGYPKPLTDLGLPIYVKWIDAALVWGHNNETYLFSRNQYWRYHEVEGRIPEDYPMSIDLWRGVPRNFDAAFQYTDGNSYFFKGKHFWKYDDVEDIAEMNPSNISHYWFGCRNDGKQTPDMEDNGIDCSDHSCVVVESSFLLSVALSLLLCRNFLSL